MRLRHHRHHHYNQKNYWGKLNNSDFHYGQKKKKTTREFFQKLNCTLHQYNWHIPSTVKRMHRDQIFFYLIKSADSCPTEMYPAKTQTPPNTPGNCCCHTLLPLSMTDFYCALYLKTTISFENHRQVGTNFHTIRKSLWVYIGRLSHCRFTLDTFNVIISVTGLSNSLPLANSEPKTFGTLNEPFNILSYPTCALSVWYPAAFILIIEAAGLKSATMFGERFRSESQTPLCKSPSLFLHVL